MRSWWFSIEQHCNGSRPPGTRPSAEESLPSAMKAIVEAFGSKTNVLRNYCYIQLQCFHSRGNFLSKTSEEISFQSILFLSTLLDHYGLIETASRQENLLHGHFDMSWVDRPQFSVSVRCWVSFASHHWGLKFYLSNGWTCLHLRITWNLQSKIFSF